MPKKPTSKTGTSKNKEHKGLPHHPTSLKKPPAIRHPQNWENKKITLEAFEMSKQQKKVQQQQQEQEAMQQQTMHEQEAMHEQQTMQEAMQQEAMQQQAMHEQQTMHEQLAKQRELRKRIFDFDFNFNFGFINQMKMRWNPQENSRSVTPSNDVFLLNLNHGVVPLTYVNGARHPLQIIEYRSNVKQVKVLKAPIGSCPASNVERHQNLIQNLTQNLLNLQSNPTSESIHNQILRIITHRDLVENFDLVHTHAEYREHLTDSSRIPAEKLISTTTKTYQEISVEIGGLTANKFFTMEKSELDADIYLLKETRFALPATSTITMYRPTHEGLPRPVLGMYTAGNIYFITTIDIMIIKNGSEVEYHQAGETVHFNMGMFIPVDDNTNFLQHLIDMKIKSFSIDKDGAYKLYPYETGMLIDGLVHYAMGTGLQSCPYFIEYVKNMIRHNSRTIKNLDSIESSIISTCPSLLYPHEHETIVALNSLLLTNYFRNVNCLYSYDFSCQMFDLVDAESNLKGYTMEQILHDNNGNQKALYEYAKGITKKNKPKKKKKRKAYTRRN